MLSSVNATMRPLRIPPRFVPYMEKHRIYELFHELATALIIRQPLDPILYMKQSLRLAAKKRDLPRIILFGEPYSEMLSLAELLEKNMLLKPITLRELHELSPEMPEELMSEQDIVRNLKTILKKLTTDFCGWILVDFPRTRKEARAIQLAGIIPTHVLEIVSSPQNRCEMATTLNRDKNLRELREVYDNVLTKIQSRDRNIDEITEICATLASRKKHCGAPCIFRVALIGSRGSGCRSLAQHLVQRFNLVHVDFNYILEQARLQKNPLGKTIRMIEYLWGRRLNADTRIRIVEEYLLREDCTKRGWVLTGYPITVKDFESLDMIPTPPNRVIFVNVDKSIIEERLLNRRYNVITGSKSNLNDAANFMEEKDLFIRPNDKKRIVEEDIEEYEKNVVSLMTYAGDSGLVVDGNADERIVRERVEACLIRPAPASRIRKSKKKIEPMEYEPDDEPDHRIFDEIRETESTMSII